MNAVPVVHAFQRQAALSWIIRISSVDTSVSFTVVFFLA